MNEITSSQNNYIKSLKKLTKKKERTSQGRYLLDGEHLVGEALKSGTEIEAILYSREFLENHSNLSISDNVETYLLSNEIMKQLSFVPAPQGIMAVVKLPTNKVELKTNQPILVLDNVQDPGNVGTMIRTADAAGFGTVFLGEGTADIYNDKVLRSMQGSHFHIDVIEGTILELMSTLSEKNIPVYGTELNPQAVCYREIKPMEQFALVMGNEGQGVGAEILAQTTKNVYIPIVGEAESLNVAVAAGVLMFALKA
ncbi:RNA methyltransferase [Vagococcus coleopterorum]|uniref:RNA methyltransferase n=1 Tax=Vagococcus coleopterorum TaxID=2714946 RepID=A0A6G8ANE1_9ENTE|nr:RNA methyltransferase [Vagococcus coleopterorum]QIL46445.1 RNA methyltransferase [Vagococcus coleopterorum]